MRTHDTRRTHMLQVIRAMSVSVSVTVHCIGLVVITPHSKTNGSCFSHKIAFFCWGQRFTYSVDKSQPLDPMLSKISPEIRFNTDLSDLWSHPLLLPNKYSARISIHVWFVWTQSSKKVARHFTDSCHVHPAHRTDFCHAVDLVPRSYWVYHGEEIWSGKPVVTPEALRPEISV